MVNISSVMVYFSQVVFFQLLYTCCHMEIHTYDIVCYPDYLMHGGSIYEILVYFNTLLSFVNCFMYDIMWKDTVHMWR